LKDPSAARTLEAILKNPNRSGLLRAHAAGALGKMGSNDSIPLLLKMSGHKEIHIRRSAILALGLVTRETDPFCRKVISTLSNIARKGRDPQARNWALLSLGRTGAAKALPTLLESLKKGRESFQAFAALSLAMFQLERKEKNEEIRAALRRSFGTVRTPSVKGAIALSLGLICDQESAESLLELLKEDGDFSMKGHTAVALGLMNCKEAIAPIRNMILGSKKDWNLIRQCTISLGLLGDENAAPLLLEILTEAQSDFLRGSITIALGYGKDRRAVSPLLSQLHEKKNDIFLRAFSGVALGILCGRTNIPSLSRLSADINYRAQTSSLREILDIL
jgi:HEAT repeat protein